MTRFISEVSELDMAHERGAFKDNHASAAGNERAVARQHDGISIPCGAGDYRPKNSRYALIARRMSSLPTWKTFPVGKKQAENCFGPAISRDYQAPSAD
jgi:hypothetical protein